MPRLTPSFTHHDPGANPRTGTDCGPYEAWPIADTMGFATLGLHIEKLPPGSHSSVGHWHSAEDEAVYVIAGSGTLVEGDTETRLDPGDIAAWKAGDETPHHIENRGTTDLVLLTAGARGRPDRVTYPEHDLVLHRGDGAPRYTTIDGRARRDD